VQKKKEGKQRSNQTTADWSASGDLSLSLYSLHTHPSKNKHTNQGKKRKHEYVEDDEKQTHTAMTYRKYHKKERKKRKNNVQTERLQAG
jgi:hypothetical protein